MVEPGDQRNTCDTAADGKTAYEKRFGASFHGLVMLFGSEVADKPSNPNDEAGLMPNCFLGSWLTPSK